MAALACALADVMATFVWADGAEQAGDLLPQLRHRTRPGEAQQRVGLGSVCQRNCGVSVEPRHCIKLGLQGDSPPGYRLRNTA